VVHYPNAEIAWQQFEAEAAYGSAAEAFDLVLTDINLDGNMSGSDLVANIRALDDARGFIPIVAITGDASNDLRLGLYRRGVNDFIHKPIIPEELVVRIGNLITNKRLLDKVHDIRRELFELATIDQLTGCHNRRSLTDFSEKLIHQAQRYKFAVSLMVIDLDHFKLVNDNHGHIAGDRVLKTVGSLLIKSFREGDLVARFGGEEFVVLLSHCCEKEVMAKAEKLRAQIESSCPDGLKITTSIGVTTLLPGMQANFETMFSAGDKGVYQAKEGGRNQVVFEALPGN
ncbi:MAG: diguanylate cyclase, partial [Gammaproteobacteria bacterium]|nr:diguanylate cyclase [Gammaproteobacteria bacterium]